MPADVQVYSSLQQALDALDSPPLPLPNVLSEKQPDQINNKLVDQIFLIGGASLYNEALAHSSLVSRILLTTIESHIPDCDTFFPTISATQFQLTFRSELKSDNGYDYRFLEFERILSNKRVGVVPPSLLLGEADTKNFEECQYLDIIQVWIVVLF